MNCTTAHRMGTVLAAVAAMALAGVACAAEDRVIDKRVAAEPGGQVEVSNVSGRVNVSAWDRPEVEVHAVVEEGVERVDVTSRGGRTFVKVVLPRNGGRRSDAMLDIRVPRNSELEVSSVSADVSSRGVRGAQRLGTVSGDVETDIAGAPVEVNTVSGDAVLRGDGSPAKLRVETVSGDLTLSGGAGELDATTVSGDARLQMSAAGAVRVRTTSGDLNFRGSLRPGAVLEAESVSGELAIHAASESGLDYEASTFSGDIESCFRAEPERTSKHGPGSRLSGKRGEGGAKVRLRTMSGEIHLCDR